MEVSRILQNKLAAKKNSQVTSKKMKAKAPASSAESRSWPRSHSALRQNSGQHERCGSGNERWFWRRGHSVCVLRYQFIQWGKTHLRNVNTMSHHYECISCKSEYEISKMIFECPKCNDLLDIKYDYERIASLISPRLWRKRDFSVWRYRELIPIDPQTRVVSLGEGGTGLHKSEHLADDLKIATFGIKFEGENPTGSFKDRGMTVGISKAIEVHAKMVACASTGNTSASLAAYAARAGLTCIVLIPAGKISRGKLAQAIVHGARILEIQGNFDDALRTIIEIARRNPSVVLLNSVNPYRIEGQKTLAFEVCDQMKFKPPDVVIVPVGNAGNISAIWKGFEELRRVRLIDKSPRLVGIQAERAAPIASVINEKVQWFET